MNDGISDRDFERYEAEYQRVLYMEKAYEMLGSEHEKMARRAMLALAVKVAPPDGELMEKLRERLHKSTNWLDRMAMQEAYSALMVRADLTELEAQRDNLAALVRKLAHKVRNLSPDSSLADRAMAYLCSKGLQGDILREAKE